MIQDKLIPVNLEQEMKKMQDIDLAILQPRSPSCGCKQIYDGTFTGTVVPGSGVAAGSSEISANCMEPA